MKNTYKRRSISILGSTGSIGVQALEVAKLQHIPVVALAAHGNSKLMEAQAREFLPEFVALQNADAATDLKIKLADTDIKVLSGTEGVLEVAGAEKANIALCAISGIAGLEPVLHAVSAGKDIALANKESLVCAGDIIMPLAASKNIKIIPVDSEHSAIYRCLLANNSKPSPWKLILTASGGPFWGKQKTELENITPAQALAHPNWDMGQKISIDSATMMNKGLELIEAMHLFSMPPADIEILIHPQSIVHSMVEYKDGALLAQLGLPDMRTPISFALGHDASLECGVARVDFAQLSALHFYEPDYDTFPAPHLARCAAIDGGTAPVVLNGANEAAVELFLKNKIRFLDITNLVKEACGKIAQAHCLDIQTVFEYDVRAREIVYQVAGKAI